MLLELMHSNSEYSKSNQMSSHMNKTCFLMHIQYVSGHVHQLLGFYCSFPLKTADGTLTIWPSDLDLVY